MNYVEYGKENSDVIILLHGGGLSWWNYKEVAERLQTDYHVVLPILDGHAGCDKRKRSNPCTYKSPEKFDITIIIQLHKLYYFNKLYNSYNYYKFFRRL